MTSFLIKLILKRTLTRAAARSVLPYVAVPINMLWDAIVISGVREHGTSVLRECVGAAGGG